MTIFQTKPCSTDLPFLAKPNCQCDILCHHDHILLMVQPPISELDEGEVRKNPLFLSAKPQWFSISFSKNHPTKRTSPQARCPGGRQHRRALVKLDELARIQREHGELVDESHLGRHWAEQGRWVKSWMVEEFGRPPYKTIARSRTDIV